MDIDRSLRRAIDLHKAGKVEEAERAYADVLKAAPENPDALHYLGVVRFQHGDTEAAVELIRRSLDISPEQAGAHCNLGNILKSLGRAEEALQSYYAAIQHDPDQAEAWCNVGVLMRNAGRVEEAAQALENAVALDPAHGESWHNLGLCYMLPSTLEKAADAFQKCHELDVRIESVDPNWYARVLCALGRREAAEKILEDNIQANPNDGTAPHLLAAMRGEMPERASDEYIRSHFDNFADSFDAVLSKLNYEAPAIVAARVKRHLSGDGKLTDVVDLGCGTGLCGPLIRTHCNRLTGVDLSPRMLARASDLGCYDYLIESELGAFLKSVPQACFDLAVSVDTLIYFGPLDDVFASVERALRSGGLFIGTIERSDDADVAMDDSGRYQHSEKYLRETVKAAGLVTVSIEREVLRMELDKEIQGYVFVFGKP